MAFNFDAIAQGLGQGLTSAIAPQLQMRQRLSNLQQLAPQAQQLSQQFQSIDPLALSLLGIQQPKANPLDQLAQLFAMQAGGGQVSPIQSAAQPRTQQPRTQAPTKIITDPQDTLVRIVNPAGEEFDLKKSELPALPDGWRVK